MTSGAEGSLHYYPSQQQVLSTACLDEGTKRVRIRVEFQRNLRCVGDAKKRTALTNKLLPLLAIGMMTSSVIRRFVCCLEPWHGYRNRYG